MSFFSHRSFTAAWIWPWEAWVDSYPRSSLRKSSSNSQTSPTTELRTKPVCELPTNFRMGHEGPIAQLYTIPPYFVAFIVMTSVSIASDRYQSRAGAIAGVFSISSLGWIILLAVENNNHLRYFATFLVVIGGVSVFFFFCLAGSDHDSLFLNQVSAPFFHPSLIDEFNPFFFLNPILIFSIAPFLWSWVGSVTTPVLKANVQPV